MQVPTAATFKNSHDGETSQLIRCARLSDRHNHELLRYVVLAVAFMAVVLLVSIALYYTQGSSMHLQHGILVAPHGSLPV